jgi:hypothetical protein
MIHEVTGFLIPFAEIWSRLSGMYDLSEMDEIVSLVLAVRAHLYECSLCCDVGFRLGRPTQFSENPLASTWTVSTGYRFDIEFKRSGR